MRRALPLLTATALTLVACVFGWRGEADLTGEHDLVGIDAVRIELPSTPLSVNGCDVEAATGCPELLRYAGRVLSTGGSASDARANARTPTLVFERDGRLGRLQADVPLQVRGLVELEMTAMELPGDRDVDLHTDLGDVEVRGIRGAVTVQTGLGDVEIHGAAGGVAAVTGGGDIEVRGAGHVDLSTDTGHVLVVQDAARDVVVAAGGDVEIELWTAGDAELDLVGDGGVSIQTSAVTALADRSYRRTLGEGVILVQVRAAGRITIVDRR